MKANEFLIEHKKNRKAKKYNVKPTAVAEPAKPRNFVAKNAINSGAGAHKDKKKAAKQGDVKHKKKEIAEISDELRNRYVGRASDDYGSANFAARASKSHPGLGDYSKEQEKRAEKRAKGLGRALSNKRRGVEEAISTGNPEADKKIAELEQHLEHLETLMLSVSKISKENYYVLEEVESEVRSIEEAAKSLGPRGSDMLDAIEEASTAIRSANAAVWNMEKTLKDLIRSTNSDIEDIESSEEWERRYGNKEQQPTTEGKKIPFAGAKVGHKEGPAGQWRNDGPKAKKPAKPGDLVG